MSETKEYPLIVRSHGLSEVPQHLIPSCPLCDKEMTKNEWDAVYQTDFDLYESYKRAGLDFDVDVFSYAIDIYECLDCEHCDPDEDDIPSQTIEEIRWYYLFGDIYQPMIPIQASEYEKIYNLMYQKRALENGQIPMQGFPIPDFGELRNIIILDDSFHPYDFVRDFSLSSR